MSHMEELLFRMLAGFYSGILFNYSYIPVLKMHCILISKNNYLSLEKENCTCQIKKFRKFSKPTETCADTLVTYCHLKS